MCGYFLEKVEQNLLMQVLKFFVYYCVYFQVFVYIVFVFSLGNFDYLVYDVFILIDLFCYKNDVFIVVLCFLGCKEFECFLWMLFVLLNKCYVGVVEFGVKQKKGVLVVGI